MADTKEALPALPIPPYRFAIRVGDDGSRLDYSANDMREYATAALSELRAEVERLKADADLALGALADIATSEDVTLDVVKKKAWRVYKIIRAARAGASGGAE